MRATILSNISALRLSCAPSATHGHLSSRKHKTNHVWGPHGDVAPQISSYSPENMQLLRVDKSSLRLTKFLVNTIHIYDTPQTHRW